MTNLDTNYHYKYLEMTLDEAELSLNEKCTPVGAILVDRDGVVIGKSRSVAKSDEKQRQGSILHAELQLLIKKQRYFDGKPITLYCSLEPCHMCMGAAIVSRISTVVWAVDDYWGGAMHLYTLWQEYLQERMPILIRTPFPDLQKRGADLWVSHLNNVNHPEYIERILKWQVKIDV